MQVAPAELEGCILDHFDVIDTCVVSVLDEYYGELPMAYVVLSNNAIARINLNLTTSTSIRNSIIKVSVP